MGLLGRCGQVRSGTVFVNLNQFLQLGRSVFLLGSNYCDFRQEAFKGWPASPLLLQTKEKRHNESCSNPTLMVFTPQQCGSSDLGDSGLAEPSCEVVARLLAWPPAAGGRRARMVRIGRVTPLAVDHAAGAAFPALPLCPVGGVEWAEPCTEH